MEKSLTHDGAGKRLDFGREVAVAHIELSGDGVEVLHGAHAPQVGAGA
jgi:hypothetical protein